MKSKNWRTTIFQEMNEELLWIRKNFDKDTAHSLLKNILKWLAFYLTFIVFLNLLIRVSIPENADLATRIITFLGILSFLATVPLMLLEMNERIFNTVKHPSNTKHAISLHSHFIIICTMNFMIFLAFFLAFTFLEWIQTVNRSLITVNIALNYHFVLFLLGIVSSSFMFARIQVASDDRSKSQLITWTYLLDATFFVPLVLYLSYQTSLKVLLPLKLDDSVFSSSYLLLLILLLILLLMLFLRSISRDTREKQ